MPTDPNPQLPRNEYEKKLYEWERIWNGAMEVYQSMPQEFADVLLMEELGIEKFMMVLAQMEDFHDIMPKPLYKPNRDNEENDFEETDDNQYEHDNNQYEHDNNY